METGCVSSVNTPTNTDNGCNTTLRVNMSPVLATFVIFARKFVPQKMPSVFTDPDIIKMFLLVLIDHLDLDVIIESKIGKVNDKDYKCFDCGWVTQQKTNMKVHVEGKHVPNHPGVICQYCNKRLATREALRNHLSRSRCSAFH